jgi:5-methylcytosine-specific restriction protein A
MSLEDEFTAALFEGYRQAGKKTGYWAYRFHAALKREGGLARAREMLRPRTATQRKGLDTLLEAGYWQLTLEAFVLQEKFRPLFTPDEIAAAEERLKGYIQLSSTKKKARERIFPDELEPGNEYTEGAKRQVRVNAYERSPKARLACLKHYGYKCSICSFDFEQRYGAIGNEFMHVHHLNPLALTDGKYLIDPVKDLRPVCPNCHAMLHRGETLLSIDELRSQLRAAEA